MHKLNILFAATILTTTATSCLASSTKRPLEEIQHTEVQHAVAAYPSEVIKQPKIDNIQAEAAFAEAQRLVNLKSEASHAKGIALLTSLMADNHARATFFLATCYELGQGGVAQNFNIAFEYYAKVSTQIPQAHYRMGAIKLKEAKNMAPKGAETVQFKEIARQSREHFYRALTKDIPEASISLGNIYKDGYGVKRDLVIAADFYLKLLDLKPEAFDWWIKLPENLELMRNAYKDMCSVNAPKWEEYCRAAGIAPNVE